MASWSLSSLLMASSISSVQVLVSMTCVLLLVSGGVVFGGS